MDMSFLHGLFTRLAPLDSGRLGQVSSRILGWLKMQRSESFAERQDHDGRTRSRKSLKE